MDAVGDVLEVFGGWREGHQSKVASVRGWMQSRMFLRFSVLDVDEGRQRKVASVRAGTPSGDTTRTPSPAAQVVITPPPQQPGPMPPSSG